MTRILGKVLKIELEVGGPERTYDATRSAVLDTTHFKLYSKTESACTPQAARQSQVPPRVRKQAVQYSMWYRIGSFKYSM